MNVTSPDYVLASAVCEVFPAIIPALYFIVKNRRYSVPVTFCALALYFAASVPIAWAMTPLWSVSMMSRFIFSLSYLALGAVLVPVFVDEHFGVSLFVLLLLRNYTDLCRLFAGILYYYLFGHAPERLFAQPGVFVIVVAFSFLTLPFLIYYLDMTRIYGLRTRSLSFWRYLWIVPLTFYAMFRLAIYPDYLYISSEKTQNMLLFPIAYMISVFLNYMVLLRMMNALTDRKAAYEKLRSIESIVDIQNASYNTLSRNMKQIARLRHDMRHHLIAIDALAKQGDNKKLIEYLEPLVNAPVMSVPLVFCENPTVNAIVAYYYEQAQEAGIPFTYKLSLPETLPMPETDFCTVLGNLLQNAMEACQRQTSGERSIRLAANVSGETMLLVETVNTYDHEIRMQNGELISTKTADLGIGTASIRHLAELYNGICKFSYKDGLFTASVFLNPALSKGGDAPV